MTKYNPRIEYENNYLDITMRISEGNPGALSVIKKILWAHEEFFPVEPMNMVLVLDEIGVYGGALWNLGEYVCKGQDMSILSLILYNYNYGKLTREVLIDHIKKREPFEKLYSRDELEMDNIKHKEPIIEKERHDKLVSESQIYELEKEKESNINWSFDK